MEEAPGNAGAHVAHDDGLTIGDADGGGNGGIGVNVGELMN